MPLSIKKFRLDEMDTLPLRRVHIPVAPPKDLPPQPDARAQLLALAERLEHLGRDWQTIYKEQLESARAAGFEQGYADGRREAEALVEAAARELQALRQEKQVFSQRFKKEILDLVIAICSKLLLAEIIKPEVALPLVEDALIKLNPPLEATVYCHPSKLQELQQAAERLAAVARGSVDIIADPLLAQHAFRVESASSVLEIDFLKELEAIAAELGVELEY